MGNHSLRHDKECANCGYTVDVAYCSKCGQKNTETRQPFHYLITHFLEDLTHYDGAFWKTIKYLLFRPAKLTKEYREGYRQRYVPPVKLYIFISFLTFFLPAILPDADNPEEVAQTVNTHAEPPAQETPKTSADEEADILPNFANISTQEEYKIENPLPYRSVREMDSIEALKPDSLKLSGFEYNVAKKIIRLFSHNTPQQVGDKFAYSFVNNLPKALFVYLPIFALWLWLFHGKKRWYYFDHGIFTLHYFSFLLLCTIIIIITSWINGYLGTDVITIWVSIISVFWSIYYFYRAHRKMYGESLFISFIKSSMLFFINIISIFFLLIIFGFITLYNLH